MRRLLVALFLVAPCTPAARAAVAGKDLYLPSVGHGQGQCLGGICSQWRSDAWIYNPSTAADATVQISFLRRDRENATPPGTSVTVAPGETKELLDVVLFLFGLDDAFGALRFVSDVDVVVTGRVYDENVVTNRGTGSAGQFFAGLPARMAIGGEDSTDLIGLAQDSGNLNRTNFGFVETTGAGATVEVIRRDSAGAALATTSYQVRPWEAKQVNVDHVGSAAGSNQRLSLTVTGGSGRLLAFASRIDNRTGDSSAVEMWVPAPDPARTTGIFQGAVWDPAGVLLDGVLHLAVEDGGVSLYQGMAGLPCGASGGYVVDFSDDPATTIPLTGGAFTATVTVAYGDGGSTVFTTVWTIDGTMGNDGAIDGTLRSDTSGGTGNWAACNAVGVTRNWRAGWTGDQ